MHTPNASNTFDWSLRSSYDYIAGLVHRDWPWEFLRRNPEFQTSWQQSRDSFEIASANSMLSVIRAHADAPMLENWGCLYTDPPNIDARSAKVFWLPSRHAGVLRMHAIPANAELKTALFDLRDPPCPASLLTMPNGMQHLLFQGEGHGIQLVISGASLLEPVYLLADSVLGRREAKLRIESLRRFNDIRAGAHRPPTPMERHATRLRIVLQALDGSLAGAPQKEIALALFGPGRVAADWADPRQNLRDRVRKTIRRGRDLMNGGYLRFLR